MVVPKWQSGLSLAKRWCNKMEFNINTTMVTITKRKSLPDLRIITSVSDRLHSRIVTHTNKRRAKN